MRHNPNPAYRRNILPGLQVPADLPPELQKFLQGVKEILEQAIGARGQPGERFATLQDLKDAGVMPFVVKRGRGEFGRTATDAESGGAPRARATTSINGLADTDVSNRRDGDIIRYVAAQGKWQRYEFLDSTGTVLEARIPHTFETSVEFTGGVIVGDLGFSSRASLEAALQFVPPQLAYAGIS